MKNKENNLILTGFNNDSIFFKAKIYPYSKTHFLMQANYQWARPFQIVIDSKSKVKGLYIVGNYGRGDSERFFMEKID